LIINFSWKNVNERARLVCDEIAPAVSGGLHLGMSVGWPKIRTAGIFFHHVQFVQGMHAIACYRYNTLSKTALSIGAEGWGRRRWKTPRTKKKILRGAECLDMIRASSDVVTNVGSSRNEVCGRLAQLVERSPYKA
jgi:hypothetical protein